MKGYKIVSVLLAFLIVTNAFAVPATASEVSAQKRVESDAQIVVERIGEGHYYIETAKVKELKNYEEVFFDNNGGANATILRCVWSVADTGICK